MKSVLFISLMNGAAWGGSEEAWYRTALWMCKNNYRVGVSCFEWKEKKERIEKLKTAGCNIYLLPNKKGLFKKTAIKNALNAIPFKKYNLVIVNQGGWEDVLHSPFKNLYKKFSRYIILNHNYNENAILSAAKQKLLQQWISAAQMNFGATQKIFEVIERKFKIIIDKKSTLVNPVTFQPDAIVNPYHSVENNTCIWIMLAELDTNRKAQDVLIKALSSEKWIERNWELHLYGKGKDKEILEKLIQQNALEKKVFLKGFTPNVKQTLQHCYLLLQCTRIDAMPLSVVEAMAMARPCIVSNVGDMPAWIKDGVNGFVCNELTIDDLDETLENCWQQKNNWAAMGKNAFDTFIKKYPQPYEEKIADIINSFIS